MEVGYSSTVYKDNRYEMCQTAAVDKRLEFAAVCSER